MFHKCLMVILITLAGVVGSAGAGETPGAGDAAIQERYLAAALRNPRHGPAVEKLYQSAAQSEGIEALIQRVQEGNGAAREAARWTLAGLLQEMRGRDVEAIAAYEKASQADAGAYYARYAAGLLLLHRNAYDKAIEQFGQALQALPEPADAIEIRKALGRCYLRSRQLDKAKAVWSELAKAAPEDAVTLQELIALLEDEEQWDEAIAYYQQLRQLQKDRPYQAVLCTISLGKVEARRGRFDAALAQYEEALAKVEPDSWLADEIRARVQDLFRKRNDLTGLAVYYGTRLAKDPKDVRTLVALAQLQVELDQAKEARANYEKSLELAPKDQAVRLAYIRLLETGKDYPAAIRQYEALLAQNPKQASYLEALGSAYLQQSKDEPARDKARAAWRKMAELNPKDPATMVQVAEVFASHDMKEDAGAYYQKAVELAPEVGQYREYYGEFLIKNDQRDKALDVFSQMAAGQRESIQTVMRLADVLSYFRFGEEALAAARRAVALKDDHFEARMQLAKLLEAAEQYDEALAELDKAGELAPKEFFAEQVVDARIRLLQRSGKLEEVYEKRVGAAEANQKPAFHAECAKMALALGRNEPAVESVRKALAAGESVSLLELAGTIYTRAGDGEGQVAVLRKLIEKAPQNRGQYYRQLAQYYSQAGDAEESIKAAEQVIAAGPDSPEGYQLLSSICERFGMADRSLEVLKKALKVDPKNQDLRTAYARQLEQAGQADAAIEEYWQAYDAQEEVGEKLAAVRMLAQAAYAAGSFEQQVDRLERRRRVTQDDWVVALSLAEAFRQVEDFAKAREILTGLLAQRPGDRDLLGQVVRLAKSEGRSDEAARYLQQLAKLEPSKRNLLELGELLQDAGRQDEALAAWRQAAEAGDDKAASLAEVVNDLLNRKLNEAAMDLLAGYCQRNPDDWRAAYQYGAALLGAEKVDEADAVFLRVANMPDPPVQEAKPEGKPKAKDRDRDRDRTQAQVRVSARSAYGSQLPPEMMRVQKMQMVRYQVSNRYGGRQGTFVPTDLEMARFAAWQQHVEVLRKNGKLDELAASLKKTGTPAALWRLVQAVQSDSSDNKDLREAVDLLCNAAPEDLGAQMMKMNTVMSGSMEQMAKVPYEQAKGLFDDLRNRLPPAMAVQMDMTWMRYLQVSGRTEELAALARQIANKPFKDMQEGMMAFEALVMAEQIDEAITVLQQVDKQFVAGRKFGGMAGSYSYPRLAMLAVSKGQGQRAAELMVNYLRQSRPGTTRGSLVSTSMYYGYYSGYGGGSGGAMTQVFPSPNVYYDDQRLSMLREFSNAATGDPRSRFGASRLRVVQGVVTRGPATQDAGAEEEAIKKAAKEAVTALRAALEKDLESAAEEERIYAHLALAYMDWWAEDKPAAVKHMTAAAAIRPYEATLCLDLARVRYNTEDRKGALEALATIQQRYQAAYKPAQQLMLQAAKELDDKETAKQAALRLFNMKLSNPEQLALAASMREFGLAAKAQQLEERVKNVSSQDVQQLAQVMEHFQTQGDKKQAAQMARQVLRGLDKSRTNQEYYRRQALEILKQSGDLAQMIADAEKQLEAAPDSVRVLMDLFYYYSAKPDYAKARVAAEKAMSLRPKDVQLRAQYATALQQAGQFDLAIEQFRIVFAQEPSRLFGNDMWSTTDSFARAGQIDDLIQIVIDADWKKASSSLTGSSWPGQFARNLMQIVDRLGQNVGSSGQVEWLRAFEDTGQIIRLSQEYTPMARLYKKRFEAGKVQLGKAGDRGGNYFVLIAPVADAQESAKASIPRIGDGAAGISCRSQLSWAGPKEASFDVYLGTANPPPLVKRVKTAAFDPGTLTPGTKYYWRIDTVVADKVTAGDVWSFATSDLKASGPVRAVIRLDNHKAAVGMRQFQEVGRSATVQVAMGGRQCRTILDPKADFYIYLYLEDEYTKQVEGTEHYVTVDYFDAGEGTINLNYPWGKDAEGKGAAIQLGGSNTWKRQTFCLKDASFGDAASAYIRFAPVSPARFYLYQVQVSSQQDAADPYAVIQTDTADSVAPMRLSLYGAASFGPDRAKIARYKWDFGGGETADGPVATHTFARPGVYTVALTVTDEAGRSNTRLTDIRVPVSAAKVHDLSRYELVTFAPGSTCYSDWDLKIVSMPPALNGCMGIRTSNDHRGSTSGGDDAWLTFELDSPADVYVACDPQSAGGANMLKFLDKLNDYTVENSGPSDSWTYTRVAQYRTKALRAADRSWEALNYLVASCSEFEGFSPAAPATAPADWQQQKVIVKTQRVWLTDSVSYSYPDGEPSGAVSDLLELAGRCGQLDAMQEFLQGRYEKNKDLRAGVWLAMVDLQLGRLDAVRALVPELVKAKFETGRSTSDAYTPLLWLDKQLKANKEMAAESLVCCKAIYDIVAGQPDNGISALFHNRLASRYADAGRRDEAAEVYRKILNLKTDMNNDPNYAQYRKMENMRWAAQGLSSVGQYQEAYEIADKLSKQSEPAQFRSGMIDEGKQLAKKIATDHPDVVAAAASQEANGSATQPATQPAIAKGPSSQPAQKASATAPSTGPAVVLVTATKVPETEGAAYVLQRGRDGYTGCVDASIREPGVNVNTGGDAELFLFGYLGHAGGSERQRVLIRFDTASIPAGTKIQAAKLLLFNWNAHGRQGDYLVHEVTRPWTEDTVTWNVAALGKPWGKPGGDYLPVVAGRVTKVKVENTWHVFDVTESVRKWIDQPASNLGLLIRAETEDGAVGTKYRSSEAEDVAHRPMLVVWTETETKTASAE